MDNESEFKTLPKAGGKEGRISKEETEDARQSSASPKINFNLFFCCCYYFPHEDDTRCIGVSFSAPLLLKTLLLLLHLPGHIFPYHSQSSNINDTIKQHVISKLMERPPTKCL